MSNNSPDYENDLVFPPQEIKSQHELSEQGRQSDVLISAIERCEKLEKEIIALKKEYNAECHRADELEDSLQTSWRNESKLKEQLKDLRDEADGALQAIQKDCESDDFSIFQYPEVQYFYNLLTKIDNAIGEK